MTVVDGISAQRMLARGGFLDAGRRMDSVSAADWLSPDGIQFRQAPCAPGTLRDDLCDNAEQTSDNPEDSPQVPGFIKFKPFILIYPEGCDLIQRSEADARATAGLDLARSELFAFQFSKYTAGAFETTVADVGRDVSALASSTNLTSVLLTLSREIQASGYRGPITFHVPAYALACFVNCDLVELVGDTYRFGHHTVSFDAGYADVAPAFLDDGSPNPDAGVAAGADEFWVYATGPVEYDFTSSVLTPEEVRLRVESVSRQNKYRVNAIQEGVFRWDGCDVVAAKAAIC